MKEQEDSQERHKDESKNTNKDSKLAAKVDDINLIDSSIRSDSVNNSVNTKLERDKNVDKVNLNNSSNITTYKLSSNNDNAANTSKRFISSIGTNSFKDITNISEITTVNLPFVANDIDLLAHLVSSEAEDEPHDGKVAVANVVINRMKYFNKNMKTIIFAKDQFTGIKTKWFYTQPSNDTYTAVKEAMQGKNLVPEALFYCNLNLCSPDWATQSNFISRIGDHWFFKSQ